VRRLVVDSRSHLANLFRLQLLETEIAEHMPVVPLGRGGLLPGGRRELGCESQSHWVPTGQNDMVASEVLTVTKASGLRWMLSTLLPCRFNLLPHVQVRRH
jgi:hypothetical protein